MRRMKICEEQGTGIDKAVNAAEIFQLPPPDFRTEGDNMKAVLLAPRQFGEMTQVERVRAAYQHAVLKVLANSRMTNSSLCERLGIAKQNAAQASRIIKDALAAGLIRPADPEAPRAGYVPHWA
ncbi:MULTISPECIES: ATP-binding protein [Methylorubrum]|uniref:Putative transcriptional regulator n=2 Tax=Methylorubrum extorquens TaxID=408 RepID=H1KSE1_METEX|nr:MULTISPECIES: ATP-binding protein [Methylorubrum]MDF9861320.1 putative HTH transcriptional regulator [Methylorubrum pseudosasae]MDH6634949.1 putative HTH transcriptional regulator [Methylobacterium sp. SuP10 SLI 274]MDH6664118.1 putative HTH transcriptional regulator [Methylorubrum zatmanii]EHP87946.1 putative transcriptional regulator [Methylorubrum extorquens DSM 13060]MDF9789604.1 putative HTH transcriptional regulator [Methylorubrum extorquens]